MGRPPSDEVRIRQALPLKMTLRDLYQPAMPRRADVGFLEVVIKPEEALAQVVEQLEHLGEIGETPGHILLGMEVYRSLLNDEEDLKKCGYTAFNAPDRWRDYIHPREFMCYGVRVHLIPWMRGCLVVPRLCPCGRAGPPGPREKLPGEQGLVMGLPVEQTELPMWPPEFDRKAIERMQAFLFKAVERFVRRPPPLRQFVRGRRILWWWF